MIVTNQIEITEKDILYSDRYVYRCYLFNRHNSFIEWIKIARSTGYLYFEWIDEIYKFINNEDLDYTFEKVKIISE